MDSIILRNIRSIRAFTRMTMQDFADFTGTDIARVSKVERAESEPSAAFAEAIRNAFGLRGATFYDVDMGQEFCQNRTCGDETTTPDAEAAQEGQTPATGQNQSQLGQESGL